MYGTRGRDLHEALAALLEQLAGAGVDVKSVRIELDHDGSSGDYAWTARAIPA